MIDVLDCKDVTPNSPEEVNMIQQLLERLVPGLRFAGAGKGLAQSLDPMSDLGQDLAIYGDTAVMVNPSLEGSKTGLKKITLSKLRTTSDPEEVVDQAYFFNDPFKAVSWAVGRLGKSNNAGTFEEDSITLQTPNGTFYLGFEERLDEHQRKLYKKLQRAYDPSTSASMVGGPTAGGELPFEKSKKPSPSDDASDAMDAFQKILDRLKDDEDDSE